MLASRLSAIASADGLFGDGSTVRLRSVDGGTAFLNQAASGVDRTRGNNWRAMENDVVATHQKYRFVHEQVSNPASLLFRT